MTHTDTLQEYFKRRGLKDIKRTDEGFFIMNLQLKINETTGSITMLDYKKGKVIGQQITVDYLTQLDEETESKYLESISWAFIEANAYIIRDLNNNK